MRYRRIHWSVFNVLVRLFGIMAGFASVTFMTWAVVFVILPESAAGVSHGGFETVITHLVFGLVTGILAFVVLRTPAYRPDLGDRTWSFQRNQSGPESVERPGRSWWTGEPS